MFCILHEKIQIFFSQEKIPRFGHDFLLMLESELQQAEIKLFLKINLKTNFLLPFLTFFNHETEITPGLATWHSKVQYEFFKIYSDFEDLNFYFILDFICVKINSRLTAMHEIVLTEMNYQKMKILKTGFPEAIFSGSFRLIQILQEKFCQFINNDLIFVERFLRSFFRFFFR